MFYLGAQANFHRSPVRLQFMVCHQKDSWITFESKTKMTSHINGKPTFMKATFFFEFDLNGGRKKVTPFFFLFFTPVNSEVIVPYFINIEHYYSCINVWVTQNDDSLFLLSESKKEKKNSTNESHYLNSTFVQYRDLYDVDSTQPKSYHFSMCTVIINVVKNKVKIIFYLDSYVIRLTISNSLIILFFQNY